MRGEGVMLREAVGVVLVRVWSCRGRPGERGERGGECVVRSGGGE